MPAMQLSKKSAKLFAALEAGERLESREIDTIRNDVTKLLKKMSDFMFTSSTPEHRALVSQQQAYAGHIVNRLEHAHFAM